MRRVKAAAKKSKNILITNICFCLNKVKPIIDHFFNDFN